MQPLGIIAVFPKAWQSNGVDNVRDLQGDVSLQLITARRPVTDTLSPILNVPLFQCADEEGLEHVTLPCCIYNKEDSRMHLLVILAVLHLSLVPTHVAGLQHLEQMLMPNKVVLVDGASTNLASLQVQVHSGLELEQVCRKAAYHIFSYIHPPPLHDTMKLLDLSIGD